MHKKYVNLSIFETFGEETKTPYRTETLWQMLQRVGSCQLVCDKCCLFSRTLESFFCGIFELFAKDSRFEFVLRAKNRVFHA